MSAHNFGTALITGASSGIGAAFARWLAAKGKNLILVARREERLSALAAELRQHHSIAAEILTVDLSDRTDIEYVESHIAGVKTLDMLINNAGFGTFGKFDATDLTKQIDMINVHIIASVRLCRAALPGMVARRSGSIINVSSIGAFIPAPGNVIYCATKAFLVTFSEALQTELAGTDIKIQALCPGFTYTEFHDTREYQQINIRSEIPKVLWMSAEEVVAASLKALERNQVICIPGFKNRLIVSLGRSRLSSFLMNTFITRLGK